MFLLVVVVVVVLFVGYNCKQRYVSNNSTHVINIDSQSRNEAYNLFDDKNTNRNKNKNTRKQNRKNRKNGKNVQNGMDKIDYKKMFSELQTFSECNNLDKIGLLEMNAMKELYHVYDNAFSSIWSLVSRDSYSRFKSTDEYLDLIPKLQTTSPRDSPK